MEHTQTVTVSEFADAVRSRLKYTPNAQQDALIGALSRFCAGIKSGANANNAALPTTPDVDRVFIVNGYAGTGKTSLMAALVRALTDNDVSVSLMAPTGRAAKVLAAYSGFAASTIHRRIYRHSLRGEVPGLRENHSNNTVYIVDEASMIGDASATGHDLLTDLLTFVFAGTNNRLIFIGDTAQLPPVGLEGSPAMDAERLRGMGMRVSTATLTAVVRQQARSGILANAVNIRRQMKEHPDRVPVPLTDGFDDVLTITGEDLAEAIDTAYRTVGMDETIIITRSNRRAADFNRAIRAQVLYHEEELVRNEPIMVAKNNYYWTRVAHRKDIDFIANGDILSVSRIFGTELRYGFRFADVELVPVDAGTGSAATDDENTVQPLQAKIFLETLGSEYPALPHDRLQRLFDSIIRTDFPDGCTDPFKALADHPYWNALQTKYAYCVTCHKAQGGQWAHAMVDIAYINPDTIGPDLYRWMYTATTRARRMLTYITDPRPE